MAPDHKLLNSTYANRVFFAIQKRIEVNNLYYCPSQKILKNFINNTSKATNLIIKITRKNNTKKSKKYSLLRDNDDGKK